VKEKGDGGMKRIFAVVMIVSIVLSMFAMFTPKARATGPVISSVSTIMATRLQTIYIYGSGFGNTWPQTVPAYDGDGSVDTVVSSMTPCMGISNLGLAPDAWAAGVQNASNGVHCAIGIYLTSWSDTEIVLGGFGSALNTNGQGPWNIAPGDTLDVAVFTASGEAHYRTTVAGAPTMYTVTITSNAGGSVSYSSSYGSGTVSSGQNTGLQVPSGAQISLTANPDSTHGFRFQGWEASGPVSLPSDLTLPSVTATINGNGEITADFVLKTVTSTSVTCSPNSVSGSLSVVCTAIVSPFNPTGNVTWTTFPNKGSFSQSPCTLTRTSGGLCSTTYTPDASSGTTVVTITATYSGDDNNEASSGSCQLSSVKDPNSGSGFNPSLKLTNGIAQPNFYTLDSSTGKVQQCYDANGLSTWIHLSGINTQHLNLAPVGYSEAMYGYSLEYGDVRGNGGSSLLQFPMHISDLDSLNLWGTSSYSLSVPSPSDMTYNFFYDLWLEKNPVAGRMPQLGDFEVGISLATHDPFPPDDAYLVGQMTDQIYVNSQVQPAIWNLYFVIGGTSATFYDFVLATPTQQTNGIVSVHFRDFIDTLSTTYLTGFTDLSTYHLMGIELGTEYSWGKPGRQATWAWNIASYYLATDDFLTIVSSVNAPTRTLLPAPTVSPKLSLLPLATAASGAVASIIQGTGGILSAIVDQTIATGVKVVVNGPSLQVDTILGIGSIGYGTSQPPGTGLVGVGGTFFDVKVLTFSGTLGSDLNAKVYLTNSGFVASSTISYYDGSNWVPVATTFISPDTVWCTFPLSDLLGTPIRVFTPSSGSPAVPVGGEWAPITLQALTPMNNLQLLAPCIALASTMAIAASLVYVNRRRKKQP